MKLSIDIIDRAGWSCFIFYFFSIEDMFIYNVVANSVVILFNFLWHHKEEMVLLEGISVVLRVLKKY